MPIQLDAKAFWAENEQCTGKAFRTDKPRAPLGMPVDDHWLLEEMQVPSTLRYYRDAEYRATVNRQCNDRCEESIGRRPFNESVQPKGILRIEEVFGSRFELTEGGTPWLEPGVESVEDLRDLCARLEKLDDRGLRDLMFSTGGTIAPQPLNPDGTPKVRGAGSRGPATIGTSVCGTMNLMYWLVDAPAEIGRFYELLGDVLVRYQRIVEREANVTFRGYGWLDDNCCLFSPDLYDTFCYPVMKKVFDAFSPEPQDNRYQHSDSEMRHLLPILARLNFHGVNLGPTIPAEVIRAAMPRTEIHGQIAPMTLRNGTFEEVVAEVKRDFAAVGGDGGLFVTSAGSVSAGTTLERLREWMWAVQRYMRYDD
jgi:uroporphyrinogen decarboxylase